MLESPDYSSAFDPAVMTADLAAVRGVVRTFFGRIKADDWERPTESRPNGWTLHQAFCHIAAVAETLDQALEAILDIRYAKTSPIKARKDLAAFNQKQIELRQGLPPEYLLQSFLEALSKTESRIEDLAPAELEKAVPLNAYNRPQTIAETVGNQLSHPVIVHGAQLANGIGAPPLWRSFSPDLLQRQLTRFFHVLSHSYWPEKGKGLTAVINFNIRGEGGGHWHVQLADDGGGVGYGLVERPSLTLHFANPDAFCSLFTIQLSPIQGLLKRKLFAWGNIPLALKLAHLFAPT
jgi:hypothetical protein